MDERTDGLNKTVQLGGQFHMDGLSEFATMKDIKDSLIVAERLASAAMMTSPAARRRLAARRLEMGLDGDVDYVPPKQVLLYLVRMGSFTSAPKIDNKDEADKDICETFLPSNQEKLLERCQHEVAQLCRPPLLLRPVRSLQTKARDDSPSLRVFQWNVLSQALGVMNDNFVRCPPEALDWTSRRFLLLQEIVYHNPDLICLQEVDHFQFLEASLSSIGYCGRFFPKPDSPCVYLEGNNGPDGCAIFYRLSRFDLLTAQTRVLEVWRVQSNQVGLALVLKERATRRELCVAATHLKARSGALLATLRDHQGRDLLDWLAGVSAGRPTILCGDFNAEPTEPVYRTTKNHRLRLRSAYGGYHDDGEPAYTTWKVREEGEVCNTLDYIFHSSCLEVEALLELPGEESVGPDRVPSMNYPSDHFSLLADLYLPNE